MIPCSLKNPIFNSSLTDKPVDCDLLGLSKPMCSVHCLKLINFLIRDSQENSTI